MIYEGMQLMAIGMGVVFGFLLLLVAAMTLAAHFFKKFDYLFPFDDSSESALEHKATTQHTDIALVVAIAHAFAQNGREEHS